MTRISVALCTYNGVRYLPQQLESIVRQTRPPDELVLCDDASTDSTVSLLRNFASHAPFPVHIRVNERNVGSTLNFDQALRTCSGDLIALSDQDDVWHPSRLERSAAELEACPDAGLLFSNGFRIDERGETGEALLWHSFHFHGPVKDSFLAGDYSVLLKHRFITGATMMLRTALLPKLLPIPPIWVQDAWIAAVAPLFAQILPLDEPLISYRSHGEQQVGVVPSRLRTHTRFAADAMRHWERIRRDRLQAETLVDHLERTPPERNLELLELYRQRRDFLRLRDGLSATRLQRLRPVLYSLRGYATHAGGLPSAIKDAIFRRA
jgi:glycosyltransferase involved in cell wall biosynthesis